ncbi:MAG: PEP-utilizing enzyme, partial [Bacteroidetes bacterium]|nr:PEP-utilizing enzyme [Bacteroidota bacterium]
KSLEGDILVTSSTDPGWVTLFPSASAIIVERGSLLSHSAIVSREMGIPCIVGVKDLLQRLKTGDEVEMNGATGDIKIIIA